MFRINTLDFVYIDMTIKAFINYHIAKEKIQSIKNEIEPIDSVEKADLLNYQTHDLDYELMQSYISTVVFSNLAIEAYIYDLGAIELGDKYVLDHLDKLSTIDKWIIIPKIVFSKDMDISKKWYELLKKLIYTRNSFIHVKSKEGNIDQYKSNKEYLNEVSVLNNKKNISLVEVIKLLELLDDEITFLDINRIVKKNLFQRNHYISKYQDFGKYFN